MIRSLSEVHVPVIVRLEGNNAFLSSQKILINSSSTENNHHKILITHSLQKAVQ